MARVLIVDDDTRVLDLLEHNIRSIGHRAVCAKSGMEAVTTAQLHPVDVAIIDWKLGDADGIETFGTMRRVRQHLVGMLTSGF